VEAGEDITLEKIEKLGKIGRVFCDSNLYRELTFATILKPLDPKKPPKRVGLIRKKLSFWSRIDPKTQRWDGKLKISSP